MRVRVRSVVVALALVAASLSTVAATTLSAGAQTIAPDERVSVRVDAAKGRGDNVWAQIPSHGGLVVDMHGDTALVVALYGRLDELRHISGVTTVTLLDDVKHDDNRKNSEKAVPTDPGSLWSIAHNIGADDYWHDGYVGQGVDVAVIDTGVQANSALGSRLINGPDLSFDPANDGSDGYGHGTHLAGIIAGRAADLNVPNTPVPPVSKTDKSLWTAFDNDAKTKFSGIAPKSRIVNVRAGADNGAVDVSQVIAAIDWVVDHRNDTNVAPNLNIKVLNLSYGTDGTQSFRSDPLVAAVANAWRHGIVVVVSAGNDGGTGRGMLDNPAYDPIVLAVGASDTNGNSATNNDTIADFSNNGSQSRRPDLIAPGTSVASLAAPGSFADDTFPNARVGETLFRGTGTSQATAVASGAAALVLSKRPNLTPDEVKAVLTAGSSTIAGTGATENSEKLKLKTLDLSGSTGAIALADEHKLKTQKSNRNPVPEQGDGSLELARGSSHVSYVDSDGIEHVLSGEQTVLGTEWDGFNWRAFAWKGAAWKTDSDQYLTFAWKANGWAAAAPDDFAAFAWKTGSWKIAWK